MFQSRKFKPLFSNHQSSSERFPTSLVLDHFPYRWLEIKFSLIFQYRSSLSRQCYIFNHLKCNWYYFNNLKIREIQPSYENKEMFSRFGGAEKSSSSEIGSELKEIGRTPPTDSLECFSQRGTDDGEVGRQRQPQQPLFHGGI